MVRFASILSEKFNLKNPLKCEKNIFILYSPRKESVKAADMLTVDIELLIKLPEYTTAYLITKFEGQEIQKIIGPAKKRLWITLLNESYFEPYIIEKGSVLGYLVIQPEDIKVYSAAKEKTSGQRWSPQIIIYPKTGKSLGRSTLKRKRSRLKTGGFLNRYDFAYAGRDVVNQVGKVAPKMITQATGEINKIAQERIDRVVRSGGAEIERVAPKIIEGAIEEVYKTPFRLLGNLGKKQLQKIKRKLLK